VASRSFFPALAVDGSSCGVVGAGRVVLLADFD
jgi:hypothetical protein